MVNPLFTLSVLPDERLRVPVLNHARSLATQLRLPARAKRKMFLQIEAAIDLVFERNRGLNPPTPVVISISESPDEVIIEVKTRGRPLIKIPYQYQARMEDFRLINRGREGQHLSLAIQRPKETNDAPDKQPTAPREINPNAIEIRPLRRNEISSVSELFYNVYGYKYINEMVYFPERLESLVNEGRLLSIGAVLEGKRIVGHLGLVQWNADQPVWEAAFGVTDPEIKSSGLFRSIFAATMELAKKTPSAYTFFDCVCNHDRSQRLITRSGGIDLALLIGCQSSATQASLERLGLGIDAKDMYRYSLLYQVLPGVSHPFGKEVTLPLGIGETIGFLLEPLGIQWRPAPRFSRLESQGRYTQTLNAIQNAVYFDFHEPGYGVVEHLLGEWCDLQREGYEYAAIDVPVSSTALRALFTLFSEAGFFLAGFVPYRMGTELAVRFQSLTPTRVAWNDIKVFSDTAKRLLTTVRAEYERNCGR